ncbi:hypothetical protein M9H77_16853 [Catharanthus roseus]|uniref:Uncharacterized protein n=1 Tax=Catharanthus roseus TaxID=4058 RepID=A0ACC0B2X3_CATRO|nr:hypothetical protein M9H77_16853 [Catharanthus roseus]
MASNLKMTDMCYLIPPLKVPISSRKTVVYITIRKFKPDLQITQLPWIKPHAYIKEEKRISCTAFGFRLHISQRKENFRPSKLSFAAMADEEPWRMSSNGFFFLFFQGSTKSFVTKTFIEGRNFYTMRFIDENEPHNFLIKFGVNWASVISKNIKISRISRYKGNLRPAFNCSRYTVIYSLWENGTVIPIRGTQRKHRRNSILTGNGRKLTIMDI